MFYKAFLFLCCLTLAQASQACDSAAYRQFDFWLGQWQVTNTQNSQISQSNISSINDGCTILEEYATPKGYKGKSLNIYDRTTDKWHQTWTDNTGLLLRLTGQFDGTAMVLDGTTFSNEGKQVLHRITWTPLPSGQVRQHWQSRPSAEASWTTAFDGLYTPIK